MNNHFSFFPAAALRRPRSTGALMSAAMLSCAMSLSALIAAPARAQDIGPDQLVRTTVDKVVDIIKADKAIQAGDMKRILEVAETHAAPHFNFQRMTRLAMGANWKLASAPQQEQLVTEFRSLLLRTYAVALKEYRNQTIEVKPTKLASGQNDATVKTVVNQPGAQAIPIDYDMERTPQGWKVYDVIVGGVSLVVNFRSSFDGEIRKTSVDGLIKSLTERNRSASAGEPRK
jgi:phospholipid transport system substrate-binding protein